MRAIGVVKRGKVKNRPIDVECVIAGLTAICDDDPVGVGSC